MNLSEIHAAAAAAAGNTSGYEETANNQHQEQGGGIGETPVSHHAPDRESEERLPAGQGAECDSIVKTGDKEWEGEEGDGGGAGGRARQRLKSGGRRMRAGQGREPDLSVRYLIAKVKAPVIISFFPCRERAGFHVSHVFAGVSRTLTTNVPT